MQHSTINAVNVAELIVVFARRGVSHERAVRLVESLPVRIVPCDWEVAREAARIDPVTRTAGLSLGDCICLATGLTQRAKVLTADRAWRRVDCGVDVEVIR